MRTTGAVLSPVLCAALLLCAAAGAAAAAPPAWACADQTDYNGKVTKSCAPASCNAAQRNLGGDVLVLDVKSYGSYSCPGCGNDIPSTCCQTCQETDGCNAWVVCTKKGGCGSGCAAYAKQFSAPLAYEAPLPHKFWGNWGACDGDKWREGMCSLKVVKDTKNPPVTSSNPADGWVSGIVPKVAADPRCPATLSAATCKACLNTKNPSKCFECVAAVNTLTAMTVCTTCASLESPLTQDTCVRCALSPEAQGCKQCMGVDCENDCYKVQVDRSKASNLKSIDQCFQCVAAADKTSGVALEKATAKTPVSAKGHTCSSCFETYNVPKDRRASCISCVTGGASAAASAGCAGCHGASVRSKDQCIGCTKAAKTVDAGKACGSCSSADNLPAELSQGCYDCALKAKEDASRSYCANLDKGTTKAELEMLWKCLVSATGPETPSQCWACYRVATSEPKSLDAVKQCYACLPKLSDSNKIHCQHCWAPSRMAKKADNGKTVAEQCEACVLAKDKAKDSGSQCW